MRYVGELVFAGMLLSRLALGVLLAVAAGAPSSSATTHSSSPFDATSATALHVRRLVQGFRSSFLSGASLTPREREMVGVAYRSAPVRDTLLGELLQGELIIPEGGEEEEEDTVFSEQIVAEIRELLLNSAQRYTEQSWDISKPSKDVSNGISLSDGEKSEEATRMYKDIVSNVFPSRVEKGTSAKVRESSPHYEVLRLILDSLKGQENHGGRHEPVSGSHEQDGGRHEQDEGRHEQSDGSHEQIGGRHEQIAGRHEQIEGRHEQVGGRHEQIGGSHEHFKDSHEQVGGYVGCKRDYDAVAEPVTIPIQKIAMRILGIAGGDQIPGREAQPFGSKMMDALGKLPSGFSLGHLHWVGAFDLCESIAADYNYTEHNTTIFEQRKFRGQYCRVDLVPAWGILRNFTLPDLIRLQVGFCVPDTCSVDHVSTYITDPHQGNVVIAALLSNVLSVRVSKLYCGIDTEQAQQDAAFLAAKVLFYMLLSTMAAATFYDIFLRRYVKRLKSAPASSTAGSDVPAIPHSDTGASMGDQVAAAGDSGQVDNSHALTHQTSTVSTMELITEAPPSPNAMDKPSLTDRVEVFFVAFSAYSNLLRILDTDLAQQKLRVLDGIRALSFIYAIAGATALFGPLIADVLTTENLVNALLTLPSDLWFQAVINYNFSSDAFFVISGFLVTYKWLEYYSKHKKVSVKLMLYFYIHRYWRFACSLMIVMFFYTSSVNYVGGGGPVFPGTRRDVENCKANWWTHLLMLNNLVNTNRQCMAPQWYLSALFQLHVITPLILVPAVLKPWLGYVMLGLFELAHLIAAAVVSDGLYGNPVRYVWDFYTDFFLTPWCRAGPYFTGIALALLIVRKKEPIKLHPLLVLVIWASVMTVLVSVIFGTYSQLRDFPREFHRWSRAVAVTYDVLARNGFGVCVAWLVLASEWGYGGFVGEFLSKEFWRPLSKLVYPSFLTYVMVTYGIIYANKVLVYGSIMNLFYMAFANVWLVYLFGLFVTSFIVHYPICLGIERALMVRSKEQCIKAGCHNDH